MTRSLITMLVLAPLTMSAAAAQDQGPRDQYTIDLPEGWIERDQSRLVGRQDGLGGIVLFSSVDFPSMEYEQQLQAMFKIESGEIPSFFVERVPAKNKLMCDNFSDKALKETAKYVKQDNIFGRGAEVIRELSSTPITLAGCRGYRLQAETRMPNGVTWVIDVRAVSDGTLLYLFGFRNHKSHYDANVALYEEILGTLLLTRVGG